MPKIRIMMKKLLFGATALLVMTSCSGNGSSDKSSDDATFRADSIAKVEAAKAAAEQARLDSLRTDSINKAEAESFYNSLPKLKKLATFDEKKVTKYLHSLGFNGTFKVEGMEEDWRANGIFTLERGERKCVVKAHISGYFEDYDITITGDAEAVDRYYKECKKVTRTSYGTPIETKLKDNTIAITTEV